MELFEKNQYMYGIYPDKTSHSSIRLPVQDILLDFLLKLRLRVFYHVCAQVGVLIAKLFPISESAKSLI